MSNSASQSPPIASPEAPEVEILKSEFSSHVAISAANMVVGILDNQGGAFFGPRIDSESGEEIDGIKLATLFVSDEMNASLAKTNRVPAKDQLVSLGEAYKSAHILGAEQETRDRVMQRRQAKLDNIAQLKSLAETHASIRNLVVGAALLQVMKPGSKLPPQDREHEYEMEELSLSGIGQCIVGGGGRQHTLTPGDVVRQTSGSSCDFKNIGRADRASLIIVYSQPALQ